jgi:hypothetical protein
MADPVKILANTVTVNSTASSISSASLVRLINSDGTNSAEIVQRDASNNVIGTIVLGAAGSDASTMFLMKHSTDTLESNSSVVYGVSVGFY